MQDSRTGLLGAACVCGGARQICALSYVRLEALVMFPQLSSVLVAGAAVQAQS